MLLIALPALSQEETVNKFLDEFLFGQNSRDSIMEAVLLNEADISDLTNAITKFRFIYARSEFENKTFFSGQDLGIDQFNIANQIFYQGPKGLSLGLAGILYSGFNPKYNTTILSAGYNNRISALNKVSLRATFNHFFFAKVDSIEENAFNNSINIGATYQLKNIGTSADFSMLLGNDPSFQLSWDLFTDFTIIKFGLFSKLKFGPEFSMYFGNETVVSSHYLILPRRTAEIYSESNPFGLRNSVLRMPVSYSYKNLDLRAGYNFNFPRIPGLDSKPGNTSFFNLSVGYMFSF